MLLLALVLIYVRVESPETVRDYEDFLATTSDRIALERATTFKIGDNVRSSPAMNGPAE
jgi:hypothetical protein